MALRPFFRPQIILVFCIKNTSMEAPDDISKIYFGILFNQLFDPHRYSPTGALKIDFGYPCGGVRVWVEKAIERYSKINVWNIISGLHWLVFNTKKRNTSGTEKRPSRYLSIRLKQLESNFLNFCSFFI